MRRKPLVSVVAEKDLTDYNADAIFVRFFVGQNARKPGK